MKDYPSARVVPFISKQDPETVLHMAQAVRDGKLVIPVDRKLPLWDTRDDHAAVEKGRNREGAARRLMTESHPALPELNNLELIANLA